MFKQEDAINRPKWVINHYIDSCKCGADFEDRKVFIERLAKVGGHEASELNEYFVKRMQSWGRIFTKRK